MDGACLDWLAHRDFTREELLEQLIGALAGALSAAGDREMAARLELHQTGPC